MPTQSTNKGDDVSGKGANKPDSNKARPKARAREPKTDTAEASDLPGVNIEYISDDWRLFQLNKAFFKLKTSGIGPISPGRRCQHPALHAICQQTDSRSAVPRQKDDWRSQKASTRTNCTILLELQASNGDQWMTVQLINKDLDIEEVVKLAYTIFFGLGREIRWSEK
jgi:hypothetical protein